MAFPPATSLPARRPFFLPGVRAITEQAHRKWRCALWLWPPGTGALHRQRSAHTSSRVWRRRRAFVITETELRLIAAPAIIGLSSTPKNG